MSRICYLDVDEQRILRDWGAALRRAFPTAVGIIHVGSSIERPDYRDVDVRVILSDDDHAALTGVIGPLDLNLALTSWGKRVTGMKIDCQIQAFSEQPEKRTKRRSIGGLPTREGRATEVEP